MKTPPWAQPAKLQEQFLTNAGGGDIPDSIAAAMAPPPPTDLPSLQIPDFPGLASLIAETPATLADVPATLRMLIDSMESNAAIIATATVPPAGIKETAHTRMFQHIAAGVMVAVKQLVAPSLASLADGIERKMAEADLMADTGTTVVDL